MPPVGSAAPDTLARRRFRFSRRRDFHWGRVRGPLRGMLNLNLQNLRAMGKNSGIRFEPLQPFAPSLGPLRRTREPGGNRCHPKRQKHFIKQWRGSPNFLSRSPLQHTKTPLFVPPAGMEVPNHISLNNKSHPFGIDSKAPTDCRLGTLPSSEGCAHSGLPCILGYACRPPAPF